MRSALSRLNISPQTEPATTGGDGGGHKTKYGKGEAFQIRSGEAGPTRSGCIRLLAVPAGTAVCHGLRPYTPIDYKTHFLSKELLWQKN